MTPTLRHVRYYNDHFHPTQFRADGWRGVLIRVLNYVRYVLETVVQRLVLAALTRRAAGAGIDAKAVVAKFWADVRGEYQYSKQPVQTPTILPPRSTPQGPSVPREVLRDHGVGDGVPKPLEGLASRYGSARAMRYGMPQRGRLVFEFEDDEGAGT